MTKGLHNVLYHDWDTGHAKSTAIKPLDLANAPIVQWHSHTTLYVYTHTHIETRIKKEIWD